MFNAVVESSQTNYLDPTTFCMSVLFTDPSGNTFNKQYTPPVSNTDADNQALVQGDIDIFTASYNASQAAVTAINSVATATMTVAPSAMPMVSQTLSATPKTSIVG